MSRRWIGSAWLVTFAVAGCASSSPPPTAVLLVEDANRVKGCRALGTVSDNDMGDLQKKAARLGGNVALTTPQRTTKGGYFGLEDYKTADVYRCGGMGTQGGQPR